MSLRSFVGILFLCFAVVTPWVARDWFPAERAFPARENPVSVPELSEGAREERKFSSIPNRKTSKSNRSIGDGIVKSIATSARTVMRGRSKPSPESEISIKAKAQHSGRIRNEMQRLNLTLGSPVFCRIFKEESELEMWIQRKGQSEFSLYKVYRICKWSGLPGPKMRDGDRQAPEGFYHVTSLRMMPRTKYHLGFDLGYPNILDRFHGRTGGNVMVHGKCVSNSSYALTDEAIEEVYTITSAALEGKQSFFRVHCFPFRMEDKIMDARIAGYPDYDKFWANLKEGYDFFEILRFPPNVTMSEDGQYRYSAK